MKYTWKVVKTMYLTEEQVRSIEILKGLPPVSRVSLEGVPEKFTDTPNERAAMCNYDVYRLDASKEQEED